MIDVETHETVFTWILQRLADAGLVKGKTVGIDATTLEANAALRSIPRRDTGESYHDVLTKLAHASGSALCRLVATSLEIDGALDLILRELVSHDARRLDSLTNA